MAASYSCHFKIERLSFLPLFYSALEFLKVGFHILKDCSVWG
jgi:hypothetical protein